MAENRLTEKEAQLLLETFKSTKSVAQVVGVSDETLERLYALGYGFYTSGNFKDAVTIFAPLCTYNQKDSRFWMGLGGALQSLKEYAKARDAYQFAALATGMKDVEPLYYGAKCLVAEGRPGDASSVLNVILNIADKNDSKQLDFRNKAEALLDLLRQNAAK